MPSDVCIRCGSTNITAYGGQLDARLPGGRVELRMYCLGCGFTYHVDSSDEREELDRREMLKRGGHNG